MWDQLDEAAEEAFEGRSLEMYLNVGGFRKVHKTLWRLSASVTEFVLDHLIEWDVECRMLERKETYRTPDGTPRARWIFPNLRRLTLSPVHRDLGYPHKRNARFIVDGLRARSASPARALQDGDLAPRMSIHFVGGRRYDELTPQMKEELQEVACEVIVG